MTYLCPTLGHSECPMPHGQCASVCSLENQCPISLTECEQQCPDTRCAATEDNYQPLLQQPEEHIERGEN